MIQAHDQGWRWLMRMIVGGTRTWVAAVLGPCAPAM